MKKRELASITAAAVLGGGIVYAASPEQHRIIDAPNVPVESNNNRKNEASADRTLQDSARYIGTIALARAQYWDLEVLPDDDVKNGYSIFIDTEGANENYSLIVSMKKQHGILDPSTTYFTHIGTYPDKDSEPSSYTGMQIGEDGWFGVYESYSSRGDKVKLLKDIVASPSSKNPDLKDAEEIARLSNQEAYTALSNPKIAPTPPARDSSSDA